MRITGILLTAALLAPTLAEAATVAYYRFDNDTIAGSTQDETGIKNGSILGVAPYVSSVGQNQAAFQPTDERGEGGGEVEYVPARRDWRL